MRESAASPVVPLCKHLRVRPSALLKMPTLEITNFNIVLSVLGGWISLFGLVSYLCKEHLYLSEARELRPGPVRYDVMLATSCSCTSSSFASCALGEVRHTSPSG